MWGFGDLLPFYRCFYPLLTLLIALNLHVGDQYRMKTIGNINIEEIEFLLRGRSSYPYRSIGIYKNIVNAIFMIYTHFFSAISFRIKNLF